MIRARIAAVAIVGISLALVGAGGCSSSEPHLGISRDALTGTEGQTTVGITGTGEPHGAWVANPATGPRWVVGMNAPTITGLTSASVAGFSRAADTPKGTLPTWTFCNFTGSPPAV